MPFSPQEIASNVEMINELLDKIRITKKIDFGKAIADLRKIAAFDNPNRFALLSFSRQEFQDLLALMDNSKNNHNTEMTRLSKKIRSTNKRIYGYKQCKLSEDEVNLLKTFLETNERKDLSLKLLNLSPIEFHPDFEGGTKAVFEALMDPAMYGVKENDHIEYQQLIKNRINAKIKEFSEFTPEQKIQYMENQKRLRDQGKADKERMDAAEARRRAVDERIMQTSREAFLAQQRRIEEQIRRQLSNIATSRMNTQQLQQSRETTTDYRIIGDLSFRLLERNPPTGSLDYGLVVLVNDRALPNHGIWLRPQQFELIRRSIGNINELRNIFTNIITGGPANTILNDINEAERRTIQAEEAQRAFITRDRLNVLTNHYPLSVDQLSDAERARVTGELFHFIIPQRLSIERALALSDAQVNMLTTGNIFGLIINNRLSIEQALALSNDERAILNETSNINIYISGGRLPVARAVQLTSEQRNLLNNIIRNSELDISIQTGQRSIDDVLRQLEQSSPLERLITATEERQRLGIVNTISLIRQLINRLPSEQQREQLSQALSDTRDIAQTTTQDNASSGSGIGYERTRLFGARQDAADEVRHINILVELGQLTRDEAGRLNAQERRNLTTTRILALIIDNQLSVTEGRALTEEQRSRLENGEDIARVIRRRGPSIESMD